MSKFATVFGLATAAAFALALPAQADSRIGEGVTACSKKHAGKCVSGAVQN